MPEKIYLRQSATDADGWYTMTFLEQGKEVTYKLHIMGEFYEEQIPDHPTGED